MNFTEDVDPVLQALEDRIGRDAAALQAAESREERLTAMVADAEHQKLAAFAVAQRAEAELQAHVTRLRVDNEARSSIRLMCIRSTSAA